MLRSLHEARMRPSGAHLGTSPSILMAALMTALGLVQFARMSGAPGNEIEAPMAFVVLGGIVISALLNPAVLSILALHYGRFAQAVDEPESAVRARSAIERLR